MSYLYIFIAYTLSQSYCIKRNVFKEKDISPGRLYKKPGTKAPITVDIVIYSCKTQFDLWGASEKRK